MANKFLILIITIALGCQEKTGLGMETAHYETYQTMATNPSKAIKWSDTHIELAKKEENNQELSKAYYLRGYIFDVYFKNPQLALEGYLNAVKYAPDFNDNYLDGIFNIGELYFRYGFYRTSIEVFNEGFLISRKLRNKNKENRFNLYLLATYKKLKSFDQTSFYLNNGLELSAMVNDTSSYLNYSIIKCSILMNQNKVSEALDKLTKLHSNPKLLNEQQLIAILNNLGMNYLKMEDIRSAQKYLDEALQLNKKIGYYSKLTLNNLGKLALAEKDYQTAEELFLQAENLPVTVLGDEDQLDSNEGLAAVYTAMGKTELALKYKQKSVDYLKPVIGQVDQLSSFAGAFEEWQKSREVLSDKRKAETGFVAMIVFFIVAIVFLIMGVYYLLSLRQKIRLESEIRVLSEINKFKEAIIYNIRLLF